MPALGAVLCRGGDGWVAADVDLDRADDLDGLATIAVGCAVEAGGDDGLAVMLIEQVDEFFAVVRVEPDEDPRVFVSDTTAALRHALGEMLLPDLADAGGAADPGGAGEAGGAVRVGARAGEAAHALGGAVTLDAEVGAGYLAVTPEARRPTGPSGDAAVLADLGLPAHRLLAIAADRRLAPADALVMVAEGVGGGDALEAVR